MVLVKGSPAKDFLVIAFLFQDATSSTNNKQTSRYKVDIGAIDVLSFKVVLWFMYTDQIYPLIKGTVQFTIFN